MAAEAERGPNVVDVVDLEARNERGEQCLAHRHGSGLDACGQQLVKLNAVLVGGRRYGGELRLGMTRQEALATGRVSVGESVSGCTGFYLAMYGDGSGLGPHGYFSKHGLAVIHAQGGMHTPEGVALGTPEEEVQRKYPASRRSDGLLMAPASDEADYFFVIENGTVNFFGLASSDDPCLAVAFD